MYKDKLLTGSLGVMIVATSLMFYNSFLSDKDAEKKQDLQQTKQRTEQFLNRSKTNRKHSNKHTPNKIKQYTSRAVLSEQLGDCTISFVKFEKTNGGYKQTVTINGIGEFTYETKLNENGQQQIMSISHTTEDGETKDYTESFSEGQSYHEGFSSDDAFTLIHISQDGEFYINRKEAELDSKLKIALDGSMTRQKEVYYDTDTDEKDFFHTKTSLKERITEELDSQGNLIDRTENSCQIDPRGNPYETTNKLGSNGQMYLSAETYIAENGQRVNVVYEENGQQRGAAVQIDSNNTDFYSYTDGNLTQRMHQTKLPNGDIQKDYFNCDNGNEVPDHYEITTPATTIIDSDGTYQIQPSQTHRFYPDGTPYHEQVEAVDGESMEPIRPANPIYSGNRDGGR